MLRSSKALPVKHKNSLCGSYHAMTIDEALDSLHSNKNGLSSSEVKQRQQRFGANSFTQAKSVTLLSRIIKQLLSPLAFVLVLAFFVTVGLEEYIDAGVISFALFIAVIVGVFQEGKASRAFATLERSQVSRATVIRDGLKQEINTSDLVPGDVVLLYSGSQVPADARLLEEKELATNEAALTGEWRAVQKTVTEVEPGTPLALQFCMVFKGTSVSDGTAKALVVAIGDNTQVGKLASSVRDIEDSKTPLQVEMATLSRRLMFLIAILVAILFAIGIIMGQGVREMIVVSIAIAVASVPEGLPAAVTIVLAIAMESLLKRGGLVRNLLAAETLGSTTYVLTDKTGTLTKGLMSLTGLLVDTGRILEKESLKTHKNTAFFFDVAMTATDAYIDRGGEKPLVRGDAVDRAILAQGSKFNTLADKNTLYSRKKDYLPFRSERRYSVGLSSDQNGSVLCIAGAPVTLLERATKLYTENGVIPFSPVEREQIEKAMKKETANGARLVAVGYRPVDFESIPTDRTGLLDGLIFLGVIIFNDSVREGVSEAIAGVRAAGAEVILITGDNPETALAIAQAVGIAGEDDVALTGGDIETLDDRELLIALRDVSVFARVLPDQKMRIAGVLQQKGEIVAMTGDGINDAPALRRANIGIALGSGTEVAKESADLVLTKDSFSTIYAAIEEGRRVVANIRKIVGYLLSTSLTEVLLIGVALLTGAAAPLLPAQILWANVIEEGLMSVAFAFEKGEPNAMKKNPHDIHEEGLVSRAMIRFMLAVVAISTLFTLGLYFYIVSLGLSIDLVRSVMFVAISIDSLFIAFAFRSLVTPVWRLSPLRNPFFMFAFVLSVALLWLVLEVPFFQYLLSYTPLPTNLFMLPIITGFITLLGIELAKWIFFERQK